MLQRWRFAARLWPRPDVRCPSATARPRTCTGSASSRGCRRSTPPRCDVAGRAAIRALRLRPGIRLRPRRSRSARRADATVGLGLAAPDWQWSRDAPGPRARLGASRRPRASRSPSSTRAPTSLAPSLAGKSPITWNVATGKPAVTGRRRPRDVRRLARRRRRRRRDGRRVRRRRAADDRPGEPRQRGVLRRRRGARDPLGRRQRRAHRQPQHRRAPRPRRSSARRSATRRRAVCCSSRPRATPRRTATRASIRPRCSGGPGSSSARRRSAAAAPSFSTTGRYVDVLAPGVNVLGALSTGRREPRAVRARRRSPRTATAAARRTPHRRSPAPRRSCGRRTRCSTPPASPRSARARRRRPGVWSTDLAFGTIDVSAAVAQAPQSGSAADPARTARRSRGA